jgi:DNA invertase Pin-like site-specific DNA recombinase
MTDHPDVDPSHLRRHRPWIAIGEGNRLMNALNILHCPEDVGLCQAVGVTVHLHEQKLDATTSNGMSLFDLSSMMAFHLRQSRRDKIIRGQNAARIASVRFGRPPIPLSRMEKATQLLGEGKGVRQVARLAGISAASASRLKGSLEQMAV